MNFPGLAVQDVDLAHFLCSFSHLVALGQKPEPWGPRFPRLPPPPSGVREWLVKGGRPVGEQTSCQRVE